MVEAEAISKGKYSILILKLKNILGEVEGHKCANRRRNIWRVEYKILLERNINLEEDLSGQVLLQAKKNGTDVHLSRTGCRSSWCYS